MNNLHPGIQITIIVIGVALTYILAGYIGVKADEAHQRWRRRKRIQIPSEPMPGKKFCKDCLHYRRTETGEYIDHSCYRPRIISDHDPVTGRPMTKPIESCYRERNHPVNCGPTARFFQPKIFQSPNP